MDKMGDKFAEIQNEKRKLLDSTVHSLGAPSPIINDFSGYLRINESEMYTVHMACINDMKCQVMKWP